MDSERTLAQKIILWALLGLAVVFTAVYIILKFLPGVAFEDTLLKVSEQGEQTVYTGKLQGDCITIVTNPEGTGHMVTLTIGASVDQVYRVEYPGGTIQGEYGELFDRVTITCDGKTIFDGGYNPDAASMNFCGPDGEALFPYSLSVTTSNDPWKNFELSRGQVMSFANGPDTTTRGSWAYYAVALFLSLIGALCTAFPRTFFYIQHALSVQDPEPTEFYLKMQEVGGGIVAAAVLIVYIIGAVKIV